MTPEQLVALGAFLLSLRDWLEEIDPGHLDAAIADEVVSICVRRRAELVAGGAR